MSSTNRGAVRSPNDFYATDPVEIRKFLCHWIETDQEARAFWTGDGRSILDPAAGGLTETVTIEQKAPKPPLVFPPSAMPYPEAIWATFGHRHTLTTIDIRENSRAATKHDFLKMTHEPRFDMVITNPPFLLALPYIRASLATTTPGGYVVKLLRLNFFGSEDRNPFFLSGNMPQTAYVHSKRLGFTPDGKTDSIEYMHAIWQKTGQPCYETKLRVLPY